MASDASSSGHEDVQHDDGDHSILPDAPLPTIEGISTEQEEVVESSSDELALLDEDLPPLPMNSSDDDLYEPVSSDEQDEIKAEEHQPSDRSQASPLPWAPFKREADEAGPHVRPFKRAKGSAFNHGYLSLLNVDIEDAAAQYASHGEPHLPASQIGMTHWTSVEKELFFEALSRLGKDDVQGIARRIRTKGELEVRHYLKILQDALSARKTHKLAPLCPEDFLAAVEISPKCSAALEEASDSLALRQENAEVSLERERWGDNWLITQSNYKRMEQDAPANLPSLQLFKISSWLRLPERIFMNANYPENNWQYVSDDNPSIRATAMEDFHSLAVSITTRLVAATIYVAQSRIRAKSELYSQHETRNLVWPKDVNAAALSIGLRSNSDTFWAGCARRLRLDVFDGGDGDNDSETDAENEPMAYDEVEAALGGVEEIQPAPPAEAEGESDEHISLSDTPSLDELSDLDEQPAEAGPAAVLQEDDRHELDIDEETVRMDTKELLLYTAQDNPPTTRTRLGAEYRIRTELQHLAYADAMDTKASQREERRLWEMLGKDLPNDVAKVKVPDTVLRRATVDDMYPSFGDWRDNVHYVSEWARSLADNEHGERK